VYDNSASVCADGVSRQHSPEPFRESALFRNRIFRGHRAAATGSGVDLLTSNGWATFENCLFVGNVSNTTISAPRSLSCREVTAARAPTVASTPNYFGHNDRTTGSKRAFAPYINLFGMDRKTKIQKP
jgi:hypothetical protein